MKKFISYLYKRPIKVLLALIAIIYIPSLCVLQSQFEKKAIIRTLGIDLVDDQVEVSLICYKPSASQTISETYLLVSATGETLTMALEKAGDYMGKQVGLAHLDVLVVSDKVAEKNLVGYLDLLARDYSVNNSTNIINVNESVKDFLQQTLKTQGNSSTNETNLVDHNAEFVFNIKSNLENVYASAYKPSKTTLVNMMKISKDSGLDLTGKGETGSGTSAGQESGGSGGSGSGGSKEKKFLQNDGSSAIIFDGKKVGELTREEIQSLSLLNQKVLWTKFTIEDFSDENMIDAKISFNVSDKKVKMRGYFDDNVPTIVIDCSLDLTIVEVIQQSKTKKIFTPKEALITKKMKETCQEELKKRLYSSYDKLKSYNADLFDFYSILNRKDTAKFKEFLNGLEDREEYLKNIKVVLNLNCDAY